MKYISVHCEWVMCKATVTEIISPACLFRIHFGCLTHFGIVWYCPRVFWELSCRRNIQYAHLWFTCPGLEVRNLGCSNFDLWLSEQLINEGIIVEVEDGILCSSCGKTKKTLSRMRVHLTSHGIDNQHPCPFCERVPTSEDARRKHIQKIHKKALSWQQIRALSPFQDHF